MRGVNRAIIVGRVGGDPDIKYTGSGSAVASFSVATSEKWKDKNTGEQQEKTEWHSITFFGKQADIVKDYVRKGAKIYVEGKLTTDKWEKDGTTHYRTKIIGQNIQLLDEKPKVERNYPEPGKEDKQRSAEPVDPDAIPF